MVEALYLILGQDYMASHGSHGKPFHKGYKFRGYAADEWADDGASYEYDEADQADEWAESDNFDSCGLLPAPR